MRGIEKMGGARRMPAFYMYSTVPNDELSIDTCVSLAQHRRNAEEEIAAANQEGFTAVSSDNVKFYDQFRRFGIPFGRFSTYAEYAKPIPIDLPMLEADVHSFYALLLASLGDDADEGKFVEHESLIFEARLRALTEKFTVDMIPAELLEAADPPIDIKQFRRDPTRNNLRIPFEVILPYVNVHIVEIEKGDVILKDEDLIPFMKQLFKLRLFKTIATFKRGHVHKSDFAQLVRKLFLERICSGIVGKRSSYETLNAEDVATVSRSFPPCMRNMYNALTTRHHLKYEGRFTFGLFLKGIGMPLDQSIKYWKTEFTKSMGSDKFDREYAYNVRHMYGKEGAGKSYSPFNCNGIINRPHPTQDEVHGCPFTYMSDTHLTTLLKQIVPNASNSKISEIVQSKKEPRLRCVMMFDLLHPDDTYPETGVSHPNEFLAESEARFKAAESAGDENP